MKEGDIVYTSCQIMSKPWKIIEKTNYYVVIKQYDYQGICTRTGKEDIDKLFYEVDAILTFK